MSVAASNVPTLGYNLVDQHHTEPPSTHKLQQFCGSNTDLWPWLLGESSVAHGAYASYQHTHTPCRSMLWDQNECVCVWLYPSVCECGVCVLV